jgi:predicted ATPase/class 3 adenylate cyclase/DNA-binding CsgD family transcriptional regulator
VAREGIDRRRDPQAPPLPAGTVTFLLTDAEGSSRHWEVDPGAASVALARGEEIIRDSTRRHGGALPVEQGEGDSSVSVFARASDAVACSLDIQRRLRTEARQAEPEIRIRIALHTGEAELRSDGTYRGAALNRCARLRAIGHGGQILVSQAAYEVLIDGLDEVVVLRDLGLHRLRDLARPEHVWQLCHPELADVFPPLRSLDAAANNLPIQLTSFVGRETEIDAIGKLLFEHRLLTLIGAGGCGKTRLGLEVAAGIVDDYPDGVWWVDLAPLADPSLVSAALAGVLGVRESPLEPITDTVVRYLRARRAFVGLDNCEHLIEACAALADRVTHECPAVTLLATSREPLRVDGEANWPVPPLSMPEASAPESLAQCESARLFIDRARAAEPTFTLADENARALAEICTRLDGIPLAIELAAARTRLLAMDEIAAGLSDRFHLLTGGARSALPRQRTLEASVDWSHNMLDDAERAVFRRLAVFAGSFTFDGAEAVCTGDSITPELMLDLLGRLVDRSLVQVVYEAGRETRYRLLETIRDYARRRLTDTGEAEAIRDRHLDYYVTFTSHVASGLEGPDLIAWLGRVDSELDNLRAALDWSSRSSGPERGQRLVGPLTLYWFARSELSIGRARLEASLTETAAAGLDRAGALSAMCMLAYRGGDMVKARGYGDEAVAIGRRLADASALGRALHWRAWVRYWGEGDRQGAWADFEEAAALLPKAEDRVFQALNLALLAWSYATTSEAPRARPLLVESLPLTDAGAAPHARCYCLGVLGFLETLEGSTEHTEAHLGEALTLAQDVGDPYADICVRMFLGLLDLYRGRYREGRDRCERGLAMAIEHRSPNVEAFMRLVLANLAFAEGRLDAAAAEIEISFAILGPLMPGIGAICRSVQAQIAVAESRFSDARRYAAEALSVGRETDTVAAVVGALSVQASLARIEGDAHSAEDLLHEAFDLLQQVGFRAAMCEILDDLAGAIADQDRFEEAARLLGAAQSLRAAIGISRFPLRGPSHKADTTMLREALGTKAFDEAWAEGAALTLDDAVSYARRGRGRRGRPAYGWNSLTPTEARVVELVAEGITNPQIGQRLFVSARTVQTHLTHVFAKLGVSTRAELAAKAAQRQATNT